MTARVLAHGGREAVRADVRDDGHEHVVSRVEVLPGATPDDAAAALVQALPGARVGVQADDPLVPALEAAGARVVRRSRDMARAASPLPAPTLLPAGLAIVPAAWDERLADLRVAAYGLDEAQDERALREVFASGRPAPPLAASSARLLDAQGALVGHVLTAGPVPWADAPTAWVLDVAVHPSAQGRGLGHVLLEHALNGLALAGLPTLGLTVTDGNPAARLYAALGFVETRRSTSLRLP